MYNSVKTVKARLKALAQEEYRKFTSALIPGDDVILGVRLPLIRSLAKEIAKRDWREYLAAAEDEYFEETMLQGFVIGLVKIDAEERLRLIAGFVPKIRNWSVCDSFCAGLKFTEKNKELVWMFLQPYLSSEKEFDLRFAVVMLMDYFIEEKYIDRILKLFDDVRHDGYYVKMAVAWALSVCYVKFPEKTMAYLQHNELDDFTYNKALQKIIESNRVDSGTKDLMRGMKRKAKGKS
jgi:3-methyladenine DNA glycosylase AlkD